MQDKDAPFEGSKLKYVIDLQASGFDMDRDDFKLTLRKGQKELTFRKEDLVTHPYTVVQNNITIEKHHYYVCFDSKYFGPGNITAIVTAYVPDEDFEGGIRDIVLKFFLTNVLSV